MSTATLPLGDAIPAKSSSPLVETFKYDNKIVRAFAIATVVWGLVGMSAGLVDRLPVVLAGAEL